MIPFLLVAAGSILAASSMKKKVFAEGGNLSHSDQMIDIMNAEREEEARSRQSHSDQVIDIMNAERRYSGGGDIGNSFTIREMKDYLNDKFPDSFGFELFPLKKGTVCTPDYDAAPLHGLTDSDLGGKKLEFPPYKREHSINFDMNQGQENTYFHFLLSSTDGYEGYAGGFGFKDRGDVDSSYITKFLALLLKMYGVPFKVEHSVMAKGGDISIGTPLTKDNIDGAIIMNIKHPEFGTWNVLNKRVDSGGGSFWEIGKGKYREYIFDLTQWKRITFADGGYMENGSKMAHGGVMAKGGEIKVGDLVALKKDKNVTQVVDTINRDKDWSEWEKVENVKVIGKDKKGRPIFSKMAEGGMMAKGGNSTFYEGQSVLYPMTNNTKLDKSVRDKHNKYANKELVIEEIIDEGGKYKIAKVFVRSSGEKVPFDLVLNPKYLEQYADGGMC